jgi:hypothetical protein
MSEKLEAIENDEVDLILKLLATILGWTEVDYTMYAA